MFQNGILSGVPYVILWLTQMTSGMIADFFRDRQYLTTLSSQIRLKNGQTVNKLL